MIRDRDQGFNAAYRATKRGCEANLAAFLKGDITYVDPWQRWVHGAVDVG